MFLNISPAEFRPPSGSELIKKIWEPNPILCPQCSREMRVISLIDDRKVMENLLRYLGLWEEGVRVRSETDPPGEPTNDPWLNNLFPDDDMNPVINYANS